MRSVQAGEMEPARGMAIAKLAEAFSRLIVAHPADAAIAERLLTHNMIDGRDVDADGYKDTTAPTGPLLARQKPLLPAARDDARLTDGQLRILAAMPVGEEVRTSDICRACDLAKSTVSSYLTALARYGYVKSANHGWWQREERP